MLGLHCCARLSLAVASWGYSLVVMHKLLIAIVSLVAEHKLWSQRASEVAACRFSSCSSQALEHRLSSCIAPWHVRSSQIKDWACVSCIGRKILYHWATREACFFVLFLNSFCKVFCLFVCFSQKWVHRAPHDVMWTWNSPNVLLFNYSKTSKGTVTSLEFLYSSIAS